MKTIKIEYYSQSAAGIVSENVSMERLCRTPQTGVYITTEEYIPAAMGIKETRIPVGEICNFHKCP